ncbi:carbonic anhydrase 1-like [Cloeon dipterum]|uniref:carbonic anhydrase 1-like n=1 Tax=Cloeon dipterum TaxID=197152 RepID=UPI0032209C9C
MKFDTSVLLALLSFISQGAAQFPISQLPDFSYSDTKNGPTFWAQKYATCGGQKQSPIDIDKNSATKADFPALVWSEFHDTARTGLLINNWQGVQLVLGPESLPEARIRGGPLLSDYVLASINFKWGNELGSEHSIDKYFYGLEAQLIHFKKSTQSPDAATREQDGFAIVSILFGINQKYNLSELDPIVSNLKNVIDGGSMQPLQSGRYMGWLKKFISADCNCTKETYYTYVGSLTNPPCTENVVWIVMANPIPIGQSQLQEFQKIKGMTNSTLSDNKRPVQQLNGRKLQYKQNSTVMKCHPYLVVLILELFYLI